MRKDREAERKKYLDRLNKVDERYNKVQKDKSEYAEYRNKIAKEVAYQEH